MQLCLPVTCYYPILKNGDFRLCLREWLKFSKDCVIQWLPRWHSAEESTCQFRRHRDVGSVPGSGRSPRIEMVKCSNILAWEFPGTEEADGL